jgi:TonB family protein
VLSNRDVLGSPDAPPLVRVDTSIGDSFKRGAGGTGSGRGTGGDEVVDPECLSRAEVSQYMDLVQSRMYERWFLPRGLPPNQRVTLRFRLDVAGSASEIELVETSHNALGASAVDALREASPFPPMPERARCLSRSGITATFTNPGAG